MSRLQKKKSASGKKKKKAGAEKTMPAGDVMSGVRPVTATASSKAKPEKKTTGSVKEAAPNAFQKALEFLREVRVEFRKVTWPTRKQTTGTTIVVIVFVFIVAVFLGLFDYSLSKLVQVVLT